MPSLPELRRPAARQRGRGDVCLERAQVGPRFQLGRTCGAFADETRSVASCAPGLARRDPVLKLPTHIADQIKLGQALQAALVGNPHFPLPDPIITAFDDALAKYDAAETAAQTRAKGTVAARNAAKVVYTSAVHALKARIQLVADATPDQAEAIITSTSLAVKKVTPRQKQSFVARYGATSGVVEVIAKAAAPRASYEWQYSIDAGKTWLSAPNTLQAKTTIAGLPVATIVEFRVRVTTKSGQGDWCLPTSLLVK